MTVKAILKNGEATGERGRRAAVATANSKRYGKGKPQRVVCCTAPTVALPPAAPGVAAAMEPTTEPTPGTEESDDENWTPY